MRLIIQRVTGASVEINYKIHANIHCGLLVFVGVEDSDSLEDAKWLANKLIHLRIFKDENGLSNCSVLEISGEILVISQFTLHAQTKKGNRPSFIKAAKPEHARSIYEFFLEELKNRLGKDIASGVFGADMRISLVNDGPFTLFMDSQQRE